MNDYDWSKEAYFYILDGKMDAPVSDVYCVVLARDETLIRDNLSSWKKPDDFEKITGIKEDQLTSLGDLEKYVTSGTTNALQVLVIPTMGKDAQSSEYTAEDAKYQGWFDLAPVVFKEDEDIFVAYEWRHLGGDYVLRFLPRVHIGTSIRITEGGSS